MSDVNMNSEEMVRREKVALLKAQGIEAYPAKVHRTHTVHGVLAHFDTLMAEKKEIVVAGRIKARRAHGAMTFLDLEDGTASMQVAFRENMVGPEAYKRMSELVDTADFIEVKGIAFLTKRGERSIDAAHFELLTKALLPLPEKWHGLTDVETRYRKRYLDLIANPSVKMLFEKRSLIVRKIREVLDGNGFMEVETPILQPLAGGAAARPFITHHNTLDIDLYLRIAPELYLKRLIVGGFERVYEVARCFRNEGVSFQHNPEFTQVEFYWAYATREDLIGLTEKLLTEIVSSITDGQNKVVRDDVELSFTAPFPQMGFFELVKKHTGIDLDVIRTEAELREAINAKKLVKDADKIIGYGELADALYKERVRPHIIQPTFVMDYPVEMKPLAKRKPGEPNKAAVVQLVVQGMEIVNAYYYELNDPLEQEERFKEEQGNLERGAEAAMPADEEFVEALKHGMPPTAGFGMGIDRLCMVLLGAHGIKEVILFPTLRPEEQP